MTYTDKELDAIESIRQLIAYYGQCRDTRNLDAFISCLVDDATYVYIQDDESHAIHSKEAIRAFMAEVPVWKERRWVGTHIHGEPVIKLSGDRATAKTDWVYVAVVDGRHEIQAVGRYLGEFARTPQGWKYQVDSVEKLDPSSADASEVGRHPPDQ